MAKCLVIVESPTKVKTIKKFLGSDYSVMASNGHVRDLPKSTLGIDVEHDFEPKYITIRGKGDILAALRREAKKADKVYLATDPDREGEAISWHLYNALKLEDKDCCRVSFNEITKKAVKDSFKNARKIDMNLVDAQQTRRELDRFVGYEISPLLWAKVKRGLSAGRVQSVALRLIADRDRQINDFIPEEYWLLDANLSAPESAKTVVARFYGDSKKIDIRDKAQLDEITGKLKDARFTVSDVVKANKIKKAPFPFTTSTLQQEAYKALGFSTQKTMRLAQQLYEGVDVGKGGSVGLITYLRTDSTRISDEADASVREYIASSYGDRYVTRSAKTDNGAKKIQDAHEAVRPTDVNRTPDKVKESLGRDLFRLYQLIWRRFVASRMSDAVYETTSVKIAAAGYTFTVADSKKVFDGFCKVYTESDDERDDKKKGLIGGLTKGMELKLTSLEPSRHFTQPAAHYTEASLVKTMEELGIGRPSTYAPTISTIISRGYVAREDRKLYITDLGDAVNGIMTKSFPNIVDVGFTAEMEGSLDKVADGSLPWKKVIRDFYPGFEKSLQKANDELEKITIADEVTDVICEECGRNMVIKYGPHGKFLACPGFPECKNTKPYLERIGVPCPSCGKDIVLRVSKKGRRYYGCEDSKNCGFMSWLKPIGKRCPKCGSYMVEKGDKAVCQGDGCGYREPLK